MPNDLSLHDAIYSTRAMRRLKPDPVPDEVLASLIEAATMAPSGGNRQGWQFIVVTDPELRAQLGAVYKETGGSLFTGILANPNLPDDPRAIYTAAMYLVDHMGDAPAIIVPVMGSAAPTNPASASAYWGSIYPAIQNLILTARDFGLGTTLTTVHKAQEERVHEILGLPDDVETIALIPLGYPKGNWGRPKRDPAATFTHWNTWGNQRD